MRSGRPQAGPAGRWRLRVRRTPDRARRRPVRPGGRRRVRAGRNRRGHRRHGRGASGTGTARRTRAGRWTVAVRAAGPALRGLILSERSRRRAAGRIQQTAGTVHTRRIEHRFPARLLEPATAGRLRRPRGARSAVLPGGWYRSAGVLRPRSSAACPLSARASEIVCGADRGRRPHAPGTSAGFSRPVLPVPISRRGDATPQQDEHGEHDHAEREARDGHLAAHGDNALVRMLANGLQGNSRYHEQQTGHECEGADDRQGDDYPHTSGGGRFGAHCSTIASRQRTRKPYEQVRA